MSLLYLKRQNQDRTSISPFSAASCKGVPPQSSLMTFDPVRSSLSRMRQCPPLAAKCKAEAPSLSLLDRLMSVNETYKNQATSLVKIQPWFENEMNCKYKSLVFHIYIKTPLKWLKAIILDWAIQLEQSRKAHLYVGHAIMEISPHIVN